MRQDVKTEFQPPFLLKNAIGWLESYISHADTQPEDAAEDIESCRDWAGLAWSQAVYMSQEGDLADGEVVLFPPGCNGFYIPKVANARICDRMRDLSQRIVLICLRLKSLTNRDSAVSIIEELRVVLADAETTISQMQARV